jgi:hypothetical protein
MLASPYSLYQNYAKKWSKVHPILREKRKEGRENERRGREGGRDGGNSLSLYLVSPYSSFK